MDNHRLVCRTADLFNQLVYADQVGLVGALLEMMAEKPKGLLDLLRALDPGPLAAICVCAAMVLGEYAQGSEDHNATN